MTFKNMIILVISLCFLGCNKPNPNPELIDPIYADLQKQLIEIRKGLDDEKKAFVDFEKELKNAKPQTGQVKYAQKRVDESTAKIKKLEQLLRYTEMRVGSRLKQVHEDYLKAWREKRPWPDPKEYQEYVEYKKAQSTPLQWNVKERINKSK
jgi:hypothetical protein